MQIVLVFFIQVLLAVPEISASTPMGINGIQMLREKKLTVTYLSTNSVSVVRVDNPQTSLWTALTGTFCKKYDFVLKLVGRIFSNDVP